MSIERVERIQTERSPEDWLDLHMLRKSNSLYIRVSTEPIVEDFVKNLAKGDGPVHLSSVGRNWRSVNPEINLMFYPIQKSPASPLYVLGNMCGPFLGGKTAEVVNLSFLQFVGISSPGGVSFKIVDYPFPKTYLKNLGSTLVKASHEFFREYIVPVGIRLTITTKEL